MADKVIAVLGATGQQGGGLVRAILGDSTGGFSVRAITRDPGKDGARALAASGAEVVQADLDDTGSLERAFAGAYGLYAVTNFWEHYFREPDTSAEREKAQAKNIAEAARRAGVQHVIWSTLEDTRPLMAPDDTRMPFLQGRYRVPHFDAKHEANAFFEGLPVTLLYTSFYWDNLITFGTAPKRGDDGTYAWAFPMGDRRLAGIAAEDIGKVAWGIFKADREYIGRSVGIAGEFLTIDEMGRTLSKVLGVGPIRYDAIEPDAYRALGFPSADEMGNMFQMYRDFESAVLGRRSIEAARALNPELQTFEQWASARRDDLLAAMTGTS